jgi:hypothetical protein
MFGRGAFDNWFRGEARHRQFRSPLTVPTSRPVRARLNPPVLVNPHWRAV